MNSDSGPAWWLMPNAEKLLVFNVSRPNVGALVVVSILPISEMELIVTGQDIVTGALQSCDCHVSQFIALDSRLHGLQGQQSANRFCTTIDTLMRGYGFVYFIRGEPTVLSSTPSKEPFQCTIAFEDQIEIMRHLHPDTDVVGERVMMKTGNRQWRKKCAKAMGMTSNHSSSFGGSFKEAIAVACLSSRCYALAKTMCDDLLKNKHKVNRTLFRNLHGLHDEESVFRGLTSFQNCEVTRVEMNTKWQSEKDLFKQRGANRGELEKEREKRRQLEAENRELKELLRKARQSRDLQQDQQDDLVQQSVTVYIEPRSEHPSPDRDCSQDLFNFEDDSNSKYDRELPRPLDRSPAKRRAPYKVSYKPTSDSEGSDISSSVKRPKINSSDDKSDDMCSSEVPEADHDILNTALHSWDPEHVDPVNLLNDEQTSCTSQDEINSPPEMNSPNESILSLSNSSLSLTNSPLEENSPSFTTSPTTTNSLYDGNTRRTTASSKQVAKRSTRHKATSFKCGDEVLALYKNRKPTWEGWYKAVIVAVLANNMVYKVKFTEDGMTSTVGKNEVKKMV